jgi:hypothetical protein
MCLSEDGATAHPCATDILRTDRVRKKEKRIARTNTTGYMVIIYSHPPEEARVYYKAVFVLRAAAAAHLRGRLAFTVAALFELKCLL